MSGLKPFLGPLASGQSLSEAEAEAAFEIIMSGEATAVQIGAFLMALRVRGETVAEITAAARVMRSKVTRVHAPIGAVDVVGTGGDGLGTFNISTGAALVAAACGVTIAKHGNRAASSKSGSADVLAALGVNLEAPLPLIEQAMREAGIGFMMASRHHAAMRHVGPARGELGTRTIFNLLGPLSNPAGATRLVVGVFAKHWVEPVAMVLGRLGAERAMVVHGADGLDEISTTGLTHVAEWHGGLVRSYDISPADVGLPISPLSALVGGDPAHNAHVIRAMLAGEPGPYRDIVAFNAAAALVVGGQVASLAAGTRRAEAAMDDGSAQRTLAKLIAITNGKPEA